MEENKAIYIDVKDFKGNRIICYEDTWFDHIANYKRNHNLEMLEEVVTSALEKPLYGMRFRDVDRSNRMVYYCTGATTDFIKVIVEFSNNQCDGTGRIVTAYRTDRMKSGEIPEF